MNDKENSVSQLQQKLKDEVADHNSRVLALKQQMVAQEDLLRKENTDETAKLQEQLEEQEKEFSDKTTEQVNRSKVLEEILDDKDSTISELEMQIANILDEKDSTISNLEKQISDKDLHSQAEKQKDVSKVQNLEEREKNLMSDLEEARMTCKQLQKSIDEKNGEISKILKDMENGVKEKNDQIAKLEADLRNKDEIGMREDKYKILDLEDKLQEQERSTAQRLKEEQEKSKNLQANVTKKTEIIAALDKKLSDQSLLHASNIAELEKQLQEHVQNAGVGVDEMPIGGLEDQLQRKNGDEDDADQRKRNEEVKRMEELIHLEEKMAVLLDEKEKMHERIQVCVQE